MAAATIILLGAGASALGLLTSGSALGTETVVGTIPGDIVVYGPTVGNTGTSGTSGTSGATNTTGTSGQTGQTGPTGTTTSTSPVPQCPGSPCLAMTRTTGFQLKVGSDRSPTTIPLNGSIVAWTVTLGDATTQGSTSQAAYFDSAEGGDAQAAIAVLRPHAHINYTLVAQSPVVALQPYFGETVEFPLANSIPVKKGEILALTVPTWAPVLALSDAAGKAYGAFTSWRSSRPKGGCKITSSQTAQQTNSTVQYYCLYQGVRLTYSALLVSTP
ncbi:MAG: hypothetical protein ABSC56_09040 [Solirubrobacteraceae bacterium]